MQAIGHEVKKHLAHASIGLVEREVHQRDDQLVALRQDGGGGGGTKFRDKFRNVAYLLIDDIQFLRKERTQGRVLTRSTL